MTTTEDRATRRDRERRQRATQYVRACGGATRGEQNRRYRPAWHGSVEYRQVITRRIKRDLAEHRYHDGPHITGTCGGDDRSCDDCTRDAVQLLRAWAEQHMAPPCVGELARHYWLRADGPVAELWALVARVMVEHATATVPSPGAWFHCACCGADGIDDGSHTCQQRATTKSWHPGHHDGAGAGSAQR